MRAVIRSKPRVLPQIGERKVGETGNDRETVKVPRSRIHG